MTTIETTIELGDGVVLRPLAPADVDDIAAAVTDEAIVRWTRVPAPYTRRDAVDFVAACTPDPGEPHLTFALAVPDEDRPEGRLVGAIGLILEERANTAEIGYWTARWAWGRGLTTRAAHAVCAHGFEVLGLARITLAAAVDNPASNAIASRLGFQFEGIERAAHSYRDTTGAEVGRGDMRRWGLLPGELVSP